MEAIMVPLADGAPSDQMDDMVGIEGMQERILPKRSAEGVIPASEINSSISGIR